MQKFLTAKWHDLIMANYEIDPMIVDPLVPKRTELDLFEGRCFLSLVGFMFRDTRVLSLAIPFHINFEEVNLRFYVKRVMSDEVRRGVVFIKEIVPRRAIATVARVAYGEPYECWSMSNHRGAHSISYEWRKGDCTNRLAATRGENLGVPSADSHGSFIIEHYWGYTKRGENRTDEYKVEHPKWDLFSTSDETIDVDFGRTYGEKFAFLTEQKPYSVLLTAGSAIAVYKGERLK
jgi:uncharacterized protein